MQELATKAFGTIEVHPTQIIHFPEGLYGFADYHEFALLEDREDSPFKWLQSTEESTLAFIIIQPDLFLKDPYIPEISRSELETLQVSSISGCVIFVIVTIPEGHPEKMTANLQGPVLINREKKIGRQAISTKDTHLLRFPILEKMDG